MLSTYDKNHLVSIEASRVMSGGSAGGGKDTSGRRGRSGRGGAVTSRACPHQPGGNGDRGGRGGAALDQVLGVLRRDGEFLQSAAGTPLRIFGSASYSRSR